MKAVIFLKNIFSTIRFTNLVIICLSLYLVRYTIIKPILGITGTVSSITDNAYLLLVISTLFIAAAGYVINDYFDVKIDAVNKPGKNKTGTEISRRLSITLYIFLNVASFVIMWYFGELQGIRYPVLIYFISAGLLYFYSASYKKMFLAGNLIVSFLAALTIGLSILFDKEALRSEPVKLLVTAYASFAFIMSLIREIIKDCEDIAGDKLYGATTLPVVAGVKSAHFVAALLTLLTAGAIIYIQVMQMQWQNMLSFAYTILLIQLPLLILSYRILRFMSNADDKINSRVAKLIMVTGLFSMPVFLITSN
jgi:4-hydroxybenzoate polyprenyltransferase